MVLAYQNKLISSNILDKVKFNDISGLHDFILFLILKIVIECQKEAFKKL